MRSVDYFSELDVAATLATTRTKLNGHAPRPAPTSGPLAPVFPLDVLPPAVRVFVEAAAASLNAPPEMVAVPLLGFAGALIGNRLHLALKNSWREYPTLFLAVVAPPGSAKTPALNLAQWPLDALQNDAETEYRERKARFEDELDAWKQARESDRGPKPQRPQLRDYFSTNLTLEALVGMLDRAPGVAIIRDEILGWVQSMDQYRAKGSDRQEFLSLWSCKTIKVDRKGAEPIYRRFPVASVIGGIQPDLVAGLHNAAQQRDGFVERILPVVPDCRPMPWNEDTIDAARYADVLAVFRALDQLPPADLGTGPGNVVGIPVELGRQARASWVSWFDDNAALVGQNTGIAAGFSSKLPTHVARLALILHALWNPDDPRVMVSADRMADAIELGEFFRQHISRFLTLLQATSPVQTAGTQTRILRILRKSEAGNADGWVTRSAILDGLRNVASGDLTSALDALLNDGAIERRSVPTATKPVEQWRRRKVFTPGDYSEYSEDSDSPSEYSEFPEYPNGGKAEMRDAEYEEILV